MLLWRQHGVLCFLGENVGILRVNKRLQVEHGIQVGDILKIFTNAVVSVENEREPFVRMIYLAAQCPVPQRKEGDRETYI